MYREEPWDAVCQDQLRSVLGLVLISPGLFLENYITGFEYNKCMNLYSCTIAPISSRDQISDLR